MVRAGPFCVRPVRFHVRNLEGAQDGMPYSFHRDRPLYFRHQYLNAAESVLPFIEPTLPLGPSTRVLEVGCGEAGVLKAFLDKGCVATGVELDAARLQLACEFLQPEVEAGRVTLIHRNIFDLELARRLARQFDLVVLKDVIEHIPDPAARMADLAAFLSPQGYLFFGFPPWQMPFGGHQQKCYHRLLKGLPYFHLLPAPLYRALLTRAGEPSGVVDELLALQKTGLSIERFESCLAQAGLRVVRKQFYLVNPIYKFKFGLRAVRQPAPLAALPYLRNFITTGVYYLAARRAAL